MIPFRELDSPAFMRLARSPEFSTYLTLRRYIWRSNQPHSRNLQQWYARGYLCCGLSRANIAQRIGGGIDGRTVSRDIARLVQCEVVDVSGMRGQRVLVLGRWDVQGGVTIEHYYLERLTAGSRGAWLQDSDPQTTPITQIGQESTGGEACSHTPEAPSTGGEVDHPPYGAEHQGDGRRPHP